MSVRSVLQLGDPGLRQVGEKVADPTTAEIRVLVEDLADTLAHWLRPRNRRAANWGESASEFSEIAR